jgi:DNA-binding transcriptional MerR regulator
MDKKIKESWTRKEVAEISGQPDRRVLFYTEQNLLPDLQKVVGRGNARSYSKADIFYLLLIKELSRLGLSLTHIRYAIRAVHDYLKEGKLKFWGNDTFTKEQFFLTIIPDPEYEPIKGSQPFRIISIMDIVTGIEKISSLEHYPSIIIVNLNKVWAKAEI